MVQANRRPGAKSKSTRNSLQAAILSKLTRTKQTKQLAITPLHLSRSTSEPNANSQSTSSQTETLDRPSIDPTPEVSSSSLSSQSTSLEEIPAETDLKRKRLDPDKIEITSTVIKNKVKPSRQKINHPETEVEQEDVDQQENKQKLEQLIRKHSKKIKNDPSKLISEFHRIEKQLSQANLDPLTRHKLILAQKKLGGLEAYQTASKIGGAVEKGGETGKWCAQTLIDLDLRPSGPPATINKISLLDVGAIDGKSYAKYTDWISTTSIDINPIDESLVARYDFFKFPLPKSELQKFDVVCLSLVLNFIGDLKMRGEMIKRARRFLKPAGNLFIVLPLACLNNSRYLDFKRFRMILNYLGFKVLKQHNSSKLTYWFLEKEDHQSNTVDETQPDFTSPNHSKSASSLRFPKVEIRSGPSRNNFCIKV
ncbi:hypothetical protein PTTG_12520 [Puccinia triticina 1-1 BBBD Race 1]|uniref:25S rRNA adenine-N(1) methyltransferase n=1 Tax=Puccinia triticina (isolate 1-1 / race 1 (BBBD)) TaxID=630390 RepID=A0A180G935_PUCT1|nr:hypothetical protein PTTG_12520 [Puccinia triticina 1-1 BBBD Race 1]